MNPQQTHLLVYNCSEISPHWGACQNILIAMPSTTLQVQETLEPFDFNEKSDLGVQSMDAMIETIIAGKESYEDGNKQESQIRNANESRIMQDSEKVRAEALDLLVLQARCGEVKDTQRASNVDGKQNSQGQESGRPKRRQPQAVVRNFPTQTIEMQVPFFLIGNSQLIVAEKSPPRDALRVKRFGREKREKRRTGWTGTSWPGFGIIFSGVAMVMLMQVGINIWYLRPSKGRRKGIVYNSMLSAVGYCYQLKSESTHDHQDERN